MPPIPLYQRILGPRFEQLPAPVRGMHTLNGELCVRGQCRVRRGRGLGSRLLGRLLRLPPAAEHVPVRVRFVAEDGRERWERSFGPWRMPSWQWQDGEHLMERLGAVTLRFAIDCDSSGLSLRLVQVRFCGIPLPKILHPCVQATESAADGHTFRFDVAASMPLIGLVVHYEGELRHE